MSFDPAPLSKTAKYKKITKPLLERKRRARINRCLDELKDLMVGALEIDDENLSKLEKADILELTVGHLTKLHSPKDPVIEAKKFQAGFGQCAAEACRYIMSIPDLDANVSESLVSHLSHLIKSQPLTIQLPERPNFSPPISPASVASDRQNYYSDHDRSSSDAEDSIYSQEGPRTQWAPSKQNPTTSHAAQRNVPNTPGLLTTVDKLAAPQYVPDTMTNGHRNGAYLNRVPAEAKDIILQKIRQHIMEKRGNECNAYVDSGAYHQQYEPKYLNRDETYSGSCYQYPSSAPASNETLDLRKVRSPTKTAPVGAHLDAKPVAFQTANQLNTTPLAENKNKATVNLPERREFPMDYSNLPPKKKTKLIEYQEYKKQQEAMRRFEAFCAENGELRDGRPPAPVEHDDEANKWRPW